MPELPSSKAHYCGRHTGTAKSLLRKGVFFTHLCAVPKVYPHCLQCS